MEKTELKYHYQYQEQYSILYIHDSTLISRKRRKSGPFLVKSVHDERRIVDMRGVLTLDIKGYSYVFAFYIIPYLPMNAILGIDAIAEAAWVIDATVRHLYHHNHALPPIPLAPYRHTASLAYAPRGDHYFALYIAIDSYLIANSIRSGSTLRHTAVSSLNLMLFGSLVAYPPDSKVIWHTKLLLCNPSTLYNRNPKIYTYYAVDQSHVSPTTKCKLP